jgi:hypothetical protein
MSKIFNYIANLGSYIGEGVVGVVAGTTSFKQTAKGNAIKLSTTGSITWTLPTYTSDKFQIGIKGSGTCTVTTGATANIVTATDNWTFQETDSGTM